MTGERTGVDHVGPSSTGSGQAGTAGPSADGTRERAARAAATRQALRADIESCGYFPELVEDAINLAVGEEELLDFVVHHQPTFTHDEVHRHITVLARTQTRLIIGHTDDHVAASEDPSAAADSAAGGAVMVSSSTESVPLDKITTVALTRVVPHPERSVHDPEAVETWLSINWGAVRRIDIEPATCTDPNCEADHGYTGTYVADDLTMRMSTAADGAQSVRRLAEFGTALQRATGQQQVTGQGR